MKTDPIRAVICIRFVRLWRWIGRHVLKCECSKCEWNKKQVQLLHEAVATAQADCMRLARYYQSELQRIQIEHESPPNDQAEAQCPGEKGNNATKPNQTETQTVQQTEGGGNSAPSAFFGIGGRDKAYPNRKLYPGEIARTEQAYKPWKKRSPFGNTHPNTCGMTQCRYCQNEDTQRIIHPYDLQPFVAYYGEKSFQVYSCYLCGGLWHWEMPNKALSEPNDFPPQK